jgi:hypothetical protein
MGDSPENRGVIFRRVSLRSLRQIDVTACKSRKCAIVQLKKGPFVDIAGLIRSGNPTGGYLHEPSNWCIRGNGTSSSGESSLCKRLMSQEVGGLSEHQIMRHQVRYRNPTIAEDLPFDTFLSETRVHSIAQ